MSVVLPTASMPVAAPRRDIAIDALRGFALLGIIIVNTPFFAGPMAQMPQTAMDLFAVWFVSAFGMGKFFVIFSFLFGFGFSLMLARAGEHDTALRNRFQRRLLGLFVFGALHAVFLFFGDILMLYAILGLALWFCRNIAPRILIRASVIVLALGLVAQWLAMTLPLDMSDEAVRTGAYRGDFMRVTEQRLADLPLVMSFMALFNLLPALAMFLLGLALGKTGAFPPSPDRLSRLRPYGFAALLGGAVMSGISAFVVMTLYDPASGMPLPLGLIAAAGLVLVGPILSFGLAISTLSLFRSYQDAGLVRALAMLGGSSLTGYVFHSVLLAWFFCGWGLGFYDHLGAMAVLLIAFGTFFMLLISVSIWRRWFRFGPDEWLLRSFTDLSWKPILNRSR